MIAWLALIVTLVLAAPAGAEVGDRARAAALFRRAHALYDQGDYRGSLAVLDRAHQLFASHKIQLSRALALLALDRDAEAAVALERALKLAPPSLNATVRRKMRAKLAGLRKTLASVTVDSNLDGAMVKIDGRSVGRTPLSHPLYLEPGQHGLYVKKRGYPALDQHLDLDAGEHVREQYGSLRRAIVAAPLRRTSRRGPPIYKKWWFWTAISAVIGGAAIAIAASSSGSSRMPFGDSGTIRFDR